MLGERIHALTGAPIDAMVAGATMAGADRRKLVSRILSGLLIATATMAGIYAIAAFAASTVAATFVTEETTRHTRSVAYSAALDVASSDLRAALESCDLLLGKRRKACKAEAAAEAQYAVRNARQP
jgi:hypothetical protein